MPASVEAVTDLGYSPALVISVHRQLLSGARDDHSGDSQNAVQSTSGVGSNIHTPGTSLSRDVSVSTLLAAVNEAIRGSNVGAFESDQQFAFGFNSTTVLASEEEASSMDTSVGLTTGETEDGRERFQDAGAVANMSSALEAVSPVVVHSIPHAGNTSVDSIPSSASGSATENSSVLHPSKVSPESQTVSHQNISDVEKARERRFLLEKLQALREENRRLKARKSCLHCCQTPVALTLLPCGHFTLCEECGSSFSACPVCHQTILADVKTYLS